MAEHTWTETIKVTGAQLADAVKKLLHEGNVRRVIIKQGDHTVVEFPLSIGVIGAVLAPILAVIGTLAAVLNECTIEVERATEPGDGRQGDAPGREKGAGGSENAGNREKHDEPGAA